MRAAHRAIGGALVLVLLAGASTAAPGQSPQPLVLQHGYQADSTGWSGTMNYLAQENLNVTTFAWTTTWSDPFSTQADRLLNHLAAAQFPDTTIIVGHSNGGLIARAAAMGSRPFKAIITVGTPHTGAPLAQAIRSGAATYLGYEIWYTAQTAVDDYLLPSSGDGWSDDMEAPAVAAGQTEGSLGLGIYYNSFIQATTAPVLTDMVPASGIINTLNSQSELAHETQFVSHRIGIRSQYSDPTDVKYAIWEGLEAADADWYSTVTDATIADELYAYDYYSRYYNPLDPFEYERQSHAYDWLDAASWLTGIDRTWCGLIGALNSNQTCTPNDGIVPLDRQLYPGTTENYYILGPAHTQEKNSLEFRTELVSVLGSIGVPPRPQPPSVGITGPNPTTPGTYTYAASASGGNGTYAYHWYRSADGGVTYSDTGVLSSTYTAYFAEGTTWLSVVVTSGGAQAVAYHEVNVPCTTGICPY